MDTSTTRARSRTRARAGGRAVTVAAAVLAAAIGVVGCKDTTIGAAGGSGGDKAPAATGPVQSDGRAVSPLDNPDGTKPGLAPITSASDKSRARTLISKVATKGRGPKTGYSREQFGYAWMDNAPGVAFAHNGCDTRDDLIKRDGTNVRYRSGSKCVISSMELYDPYTGRKIDWTKTHASTVQIDHVMPLSYDWQMGAAHWSKDKREAIANDPLNLIPVDGPSNSAKGDSGPASWLPPSSVIRCSYAVRIAQVSLKYALPVTTADKQAMLTQCGG